MFYIYRYVNKINGKVYIGQTYNLNRRKSNHILDAKNGSDFHFHNAIRKYGIDGFEYTVIASCLTQDDANETETACIAQYGSFDRSIGYNMTTGGGSFRHREETKIKLSAKKTAAYQNFSEEKRAEISARLSTAHQNFSEEKRAEISAKKTAAHQNFSEEKRAEISAKKSAAYNNMSEEKRAEISAKISAAHLNFSEEKKSDISNKRSKANRKLTDEQELEVYNLNLSGITKAELAKRYGFSEGSCINRICKRVKIKKRLLALAPSPISE